MLNRDAEKHLQVWFNTSPRKPLVLRGARQVGKSTLVRHFAEKNKLTLNEINLERHLYLDDIFKKLDIEQILKELEALTGKSIQAPDSLLFLDEIQATPHSLQVLRYFYEEKPSIPVISAGSLLEFTLADHHFSMPVGRIEYYHLGPMTFKEYLDAVESSLIEYLESFQLGEAIPEIAHKKLIKRQREFLFVGGMPEAVNAYSEKGSLIDVTNVHRSIAETYQDDFAKYATQKDLMLMQKIFRQIPRTVGQKVKYVNLSRDERSGKVKAVIDLLTKARICHQVFHSHCSGIPLFADINENTYKLLFMDVGMAAYLCGLDWIAFQSLNDQSIVNEGGMAEQFIGQHLLGPYESPKLTYWLRESKSTNAEVDYVIARGNKIIPVEIKSGTSGSLKSLQQFVLKKQRPFAVRFDMNIPSIQRIEHAARTAEGSELITYTLLSLPLYLIEELPRILDGLRSKGELG